MHVDPLFSLAMMYFSDAMHQSLDFLYFWLSRITRNLG